MLAPRVMVHFAMAMALVTDHDYEEVATLLTGTLAWWGCRDDKWEAPTSGWDHPGSQAPRARAAAGADLTGAVPVADELARWAYLGPWWLMAIDGFGPPWTQLPGAVRAPSRLLTFARTLLRATEGGQCVAPQ